MDYLIVTKIQLGIAIIIVEEEVIGFASLSSYIFQ